jgi:hypothetical protein
MTCALRIDDGTWSGGYRFLIQIQEFPMFQCLGFGFGRCCLIFSLIACCHDRCDTPPAKAPTTTSCPAYYQLVNGVCIPNQGE